MTRMMRLFLCVLMLAGVLSDVSLAAVTREERKEAAAWVKQEISRRQKALSLLTKVKDERTAARVGPALAALYSSAAGGQTAMGEVGPAARPVGEAMEAEDRKNAARVEKQKAALAAEKGRIEALELDCPELKAGLELMEKEP